MSTSFKHHRREGRMSILAAAGFLAALLSTSCAPKVDTAAIAQELTRLDDDWSKSAATRDAAKVAAFYAEDAVAYPPNEPVAVGRAAAEKVWAAYFADSTYTISWTTERAEAAQSGELGFTAGSYADSYMGPDSLMVNGKGKYLCVWEKQADGSWKATHDMWNVDTK